MDADPAASMRCWAIGLELGGREYDIPALPAADWWPVIVSGDPGQVLDLVVSSDDLDERLLLGEVGTTELGVAVVDAIEQAAGRSFHVAYVLATVAAMHWPTINGALARRGFRWDVMPLGAALDAIFSVVTENMDAEARKKFDMLLASENLTGKTKPRDRRKMVADFETLAGPMPTGGRTATAERSGSERPKTQPRPRPPRPDGPSPAPTPPRAPRARSARAAKSASPADGA
jgi:hypothetical protein